MAQKTFIKVIMLTPNIKLVININNYCACSIAHQGEEKPMCKVLISLWKGIVTWGR